MMKRRSRWSKLQFSIRSLLIAAAISGAGIAAYQERNRRHLIAEIERAGGAVKFDDTAKTVFPSKRVKQVEIPYATLKKLGLGELKAFPHLSQLTVRDLNYTLTPSQGAFSVYTVDGVFFDSERDGDFLKTYDGATKQELVLRSRSADRSSSPDVSPER